MVNMTRHVFRSIGLVVFTVLLFFLAHQSLEVSWQSMLSEPLSSILSEPEASVAEQPREVMSAPEQQAPQKALPPAASAASAQPLVANQPPVDSEAEVDDRNTEAKPDENADSETLRLASASEAEQAQAVAAAQKISVKAPKEQLTDLLAAGGDLVEQGVRLPQLVAGWELADIEKLVLDGHGVMVAEWQGRMYRVVPAADSVLSSQEFSVLTQATRKQMSNRAISVNLTRKRGRWVDTSARPRMRKLERSFLGFVGGDEASPPPRISFYASVSFDGYLRAKQLGALAEADIFLDNPAVPESVATIGQFSVAGSRPRYLIQRLRVGSQVYPWDDPEARLAY